MENSIRHLLKRDKRDGQKNSKKLSKKLQVNMVLNNMKKGYYYMDEDLIIVIDLQKSNFSDGYYINFGFFIKEMHQNITFPATNICDVFSRLTIDYDGKTYDCIHYSEIEPCVLKEGLRKKIKTCLVPVMQEGLGRYFELYPQNICIATLNAKNSLAYK